MQMLRPRAITILALLLAPLFARAVGPIDWLAQRKIDDAAQGGDSNRVGFI
jgi:hypothetical protein